MPRASASSASPAPSARPAAASRSASPHGEPLSRYREKRNFEITPEPGPEPVASRGRKPAGRSAGKGGAAAARPAQALSFVIQKHWASRLHYDFRLELDGVLLSWAVPKGPSLDPADKRMAIHVEDHPVAYGGFEGTIPEGQYGAGQVIVWDRGTWEPVDDPHQGLAAGKLAFRLHGDKLSGLWELVRIAKGGERQEPWLLFKKRDESARPKAEFDVIAALPDSVLGGRPSASTAQAKAESPQLAAPATVRRSAPASPAAEPPAATGRKGAPARGPVLHGVALPGAARAALPDRLTPQLATLATGVPARGRWIYEVKFDGYRIMARIQRGKARLITRGGHDWSDRMPGLVKELSQLGLKSGWLDGEIVVLNDAGTPDFNALQKAFDRPASSAEVVYFLFDLPFADGLDLREVPLLQRRQALQAVLDAAPTPHLRYSADFQAAPGDLLQSACRMKLEGVIAKREDAPYASRRTETWLKLKCKQRQEFVVCGYTDRSDGSPQIGSLLLGVHDDSGALVSAGSVGTGWSSQEARALKQQLQPLEVDKSPFTAPPGKPGRWSRRVAGSERWVKPQRVAEVEFAEWTPDGQVRHASYVSMRTDKPAKAITRETAKEVGTPAPEASAARPSRARPAEDAVKVTHGDRVIDPSTGLTKLALVRYYESVAPWILPHLKGRPVSLVRAPGGITGQIFFQKHDDKLSIPGLKTLPPDLWPEHPPLLEVPDARALLSAAQMNVVEFHTWNAPSRRVALPDRLVFDLDPGEGTGWPHVQEAATLVRALLEELGLQSWLKTSGGKGLHVVVPITPRLDYDTVKAFSKAVVQHMAQTLPQRFVAKPGGSHRVGKIFIDYLRNGFGQTTAAAFSARARPGMGVSMPVGWEQLGELKSGAQWTITNAREYLSLRREDPWEGFARKRQSLAKGMKALGVKPAEPASRTIGDP